MNENTTTDLRSDHAIIEFESDRAAFGRWFNNPMGLDAPQSEIHCALVNFKIDALSSEEAVEDIETLLMAAFQFGIERGIEIGENQ